MRSVLQCVRIVCGIWSQLMVSRVFVVEVARDSSSSQTARHFERIRERGERDLGICGSAEAAVAREQRGRECVCALGSGRRE